VFIAAAEQNPRCNLPGVSGLLGWSPLTLAVLLLGHARHDGHRDGHVRRAEPARAHAGGDLVPGRDGRRGQIMLGTHHGLAFVL
jgi:hypothetical protein